MSGTQEPDHLLAELLELTRRQRDPTEGCLWSGAQTLVNSSLSTRVTR